MFLSPFSKQFPGYSRLLRSPVITRIVGTLRIEYETFAKYGRNKETTSTMHLGVA